jgi:hypothetical protein
VPKPTCAGPRPYRTPRSNSAVFAEVCSQPRATGGTGEGSWTKGPGGETLGDGISAGVVRQSPPLDEALTGTRIPASGSKMRIVGSEPLR